MGSAGSAQGCLEASCQYESGTPILPLLPLALPPDPGDSEPDHGGPGTPGTCQPHHPAGTRQAVPGTHLERRPPLPWRLCPRTCPLKAGELGRPGHRLCEQEASLSTDGATREHGACASLNTNPSTSPGLAGRVPSATVSHSGWGLRLWVGTQGWGLRLWLCDPTRTPQRCPFLEPRARERCWIVSKGQVTLPSTQQPAPSGHVQEAVGPSRGASPFPGEMPAWSAVNSRVPREPRLLETPALWTTISTRSTVGKQIEPPVLSQSVWPAVSSRPGPIGAGSCSWTVIHRHRDRRIGNQVLSPSLTYASCSCGEGSKHSQAHGTGHPRQAAEAGAGVLRTAPPLPREATGLPAGPWSYSG